MFTWILTNIKNLSIGLIGLAGFFLYNSNKKLKKENQELENTVKDNSKIIDIQQKVIDVTENTKPSDFDGNIKRMQDGKL